MFDKAAAQNLYDQLVRINKEAFEAGMYDAAYHALCSAMHCAQHLESDQALLDIKNKAEEELAWIDLYKPGYEYSSTSSAERNHESIYKMLSRQAEAKVKIRQNNRKQFKAF